MRPPPSSTRRVARGGTRNPAFARCDEDRGRGVRSEGVDGARYVWGRGTKGYRAIGWEGTSRSGELRGELGGH